MDDWIKKRPELLATIWAVFVISQILSLVTFSASSAQSNWIGLVGFTCGWFWYFFFGISSFFILAAIAHLAYRQLFLSKQTTPRHIFSLFIAASALSLLFTIFAAIFPQIELFLAKYLGFTNATFHLGGMPFFALFHKIPYLNFEALLSFFGTGFIALSTLLLSLSAFFEVSIKEIFLKLWKKKEPAVKPSTIDAKPMPRTLPVKRSMPQIDHFLDIEQDYPIGLEVKNSVKKAITTKAKIKKEPAPLPSTCEEPKSFGSFSIPSLELLTTVKKADSTNLVKELKTKADLLEETLLSFGIEAKVGQIHCGPTITSFEVHPAVGVKIGKIKTLEHDIALNLEAKSIRIIAPIPGKPAVGIEVPNKSPQEVSFKELLAGYKEMGSPCKIPMLLGKAVNGDLVIADLAKMPHCIIAGATGSGKSVCINSIVMSILMTMSPDEIRLVMIDPKKVELTPYTNLPHMIAPVITEPHNACSALQWLVKEMEKRYEILKLTGQRNIDAFNRRKIDENVEKGCHITIPEKLPYYVGIIDELADLMMVASQDIETPIARIAQMARAVGIHLILATQRPSREVITGLIRANFPARISFKVSSRVNSQIILDEPGSENLLGNGDMLFLLPGSPQLIRAQGAYVRDSEINDVIENICSQAPSQYLIKSFDEVHVAQGGKKASGDNSDDALYGEAKSIVFSTGNASTTFLQRKLKIGYARAASLMDALEADGVVTPQDGSKPRKVLYPKSEEMAEAELFEE